MVSSAGDVASSLVTDAIQNRLAFISEMRSDLWQLSSEADMEQRHALAGVDETKTFVHVHVHVHVQAAVVNVANSRNEPEHKAPRR